MEFDYVEKLIIDADDVKEKIRNDYYPEDVFTDEQLSTWAEENGYIKEKS